MIKVRDEVRLHSGPLMSVDKIDKKGIATCSWNIDGKQMTATGPADKLTKVLYGYWEFIQGAIVDRNSKLHNTYEYWEHWELPNGQQQWFAVAQRDVSIEALGPPPAPLLIDANQNPDPSANAWAANGWAVGGPMPKA
jgi:hypothetical protein